MKCLNKNEYHMTKTQGTLNRAISHSFCIFTYDKRKIVHNIFI